MALSTGSGPTTVIGVMPPGFTVVGQKADFLVPYGQSLEQLRAVSGRGNAYAIARLRDAVSFAQAASDMRAIFADLDRQFPHPNPRRTPIPLPLHQHLFA